MMYNNKFIASLKVDKNFLREDKDTVFLPFGSEYAIYMKNLEGRTAVVSISLDGEDVLDGNELVVRPGMSAVLEGFMKGSKVDGKFRFIQKTAQIQEHRGDKIDDGFLRITFRFEKPRPPMPVYRPEFRSKGVGRAGGQSVGSYNSDTSLARGIPSASADEGFASMSWASEEGTYNSASLTGQSVSTPRPEEGITVRGSDSAQTFTRTTVGELETEEHVIVLKLMGVNPETAVAVEQPVTVKTKKVCPTCGTTSDSLMKFCGKCGTRLD